MRYCGVLHIAEMLANAARVAPDTVAATLDDTAITFGEIDIYRADVLLQSLDLATARNRNDPRLLSEQPSERDLRWRRLFLLSNPGQQVDHGLIGRDGLRREARVAAANV